MTDQPSQQPAATPEKIPWPRVIGFGLAGFAITALVWFLCRAYTGVFEVLNLRVFVGAVALVPVVLLVQHASGNSRSVAVTLAASLLGMAAIAAGEGLATLVTGKAIPWGKFNLMFLFVAAVVPFGMRAKE